MFNNLNAEMARKKISIKALAEITGINMLEAQDGNPMFPVEQTSQNLDEAFNTLCRAIFREYVTLLRKLKLPVPILPTHKNSAL